MKSSPTSAFAVLLLVVVALGLRLGPIDHGMPRGYVPDNHVVRSALGMARDKDPIPPAGKYSTYPYLVPYVLLPVYASQYALGKVAGDWQTSDEFGARVMEDPGLVQVPARIVMALFGAATAWALFAAARAAGLGLGAWIAAWLSATCLLNVQLSTHERPWVVVVFFGALSLASALRFAAAGRTRSLLWSGVWAGLGFASHQAGLVLLALPACAWLAVAAPWGWLGPVGGGGPADPASREALPRRRIGSQIGLGALCVALFVLAGLVCGHAYYLRYGAVAQEQVVGGALAADKLSIGGQAVALGLSFDSAQRLSGALFGYDPVLLVLGLLGILAARGRADAATHRTRLGVNLGLLLIGGFFFFNPSDHVRYLLPVCMLLALPAGAFAERLLALCGSGGGRTLMGLLLLVPLVQALRLDWLLGQEDTRAVAERELDALPAGARVAIDHYGPTPDLSRAALARIGELRELYRREGHRLAVLESGADSGLDAIGVEELFEIDPDTHEYVVRGAARALGERPRDVLAVLGITHLLEVDRRPRPGGNSWLAALAQAGETLAVIDPSSGTRPPAEAFLPTEMDFPLTGLWQVKRPGPWMRLVELAD